MIDLKIPFGLEFEEQELLLPLLESIGIIEFFSREFGRHLLQFTEIPSPSSDSGLFRASVVVVWSGVGLWW